MTQAGGAETQALRPAIVGALVVCVAVAMAPWMSGGQEPLALLISAGVLTAGTLLAWVQPAVRALFRGPLVYAYVAFVGFGALSLLWSANRYSTALWLVMWLMAGVAFRLTHAVAGEPDGREWLLRAYIVSAAIFCAAAVWMFCTGEYNRLTGWFYWPNPAAAYLMPVVLITLDRVRQSIGRQVWAWSGLAAFFGACFVLTGSRAAALVLGAVVVVYLLVMPLKKPDWVKIVFIGIAAVALSTALWQVSTIFAQKSDSTAPGARFGQGSEGAARSLGDRWFYLKSVAAIAEDNPWGGTGAGTFGDVHPRYQERVVSASTSAHNVYAQTLAELGVVGLVLLGIVLLTLGFGVLRGLMERPDLVPVALGGAALLMHFGLDIDARYPALLLLAAVLGGVCFVQFQGGKRPFGWRWPLVSALLLVPVVSLYQSNEALVRARAAQEDGDYPEAAALYGKAVRGISFNPDIVNAEGIALFVVASGGGPDAMTSRKLALERARRAQALDPADGQHHQLEGRVLALQGDLTGAERAFKRALVLDPYNHPGYALDLAAVQLQAGQPGQAVATARAMLAQYPPSVIANRHMDPTLRPALANLYALIGNVYLVEGRIEEARREAERAVQIYPESVRGRGLRNAVERLSL